jgi:GntR family transcriptional repressor for pyruvate dehydrogenase complex
MSRQGPAREKLKNHATLSGEIADRLCRQIRRKRLGPGARLGTEAELADQYGVSRTVIREAVGHLRGLGVVTSRQGLGLSVASNDVMGTLEKVLAPVVAGGQHFPELCKLRFIFELGALPLAVEQATPGQIERMRQLADDMLALVRRRSLSPQELNAAVTAREVEFHQLIFEAAGSEIAGRFHELLLEFFQETGPQGPHSAPPDLKGMQEHVRLVEAIADRDVSRATQVLAEHLRHFLIPQQA